MSDQVPDATDVSRQLASCMRIPGAGVTCCLTLHPHCFALYSYPSHVNPSPSVHPLMPHITHLSNTSTLPPHCPYSAGIIRRAWHAQLLFCSPCLATAPYHCWLCLHHASLGYCTISLLVVPAPRVAPFLLLIVPASTLVCQTCCTYGDLDGVMQWCTARVVRCIWRAN